jgi:hypothetical protein
MTNDETSLDMIFSKDQSVYPKKLDKIVFSSKKHESLTRQAHALFLKICDSMNGKLEPKRRALLEDLRIKALERYERRRDHPTL